MSLSINRMEEKNLRDWFETNDYIILNIFKLVKYLCENYYIRTKEDVVIRNLELMEAENVPLDWIDYDAVINQDDDFYELGANRYLNIYEIEEDWDEYEMNKRQHELFKYVQKRE